MPSPKFLDFLIAFPHLKPVTMVRGALPNWSKFGMALNASEHCLEFFFQKF